MGWGFRMFFSFFPLCVTSIFMYLGGLIFNMWGKRMKKEHAEEPHTYRYMVGKEALINQLLLPIFELLDCAFWCQFLMTATVLSVITSERHGICKKG